MQLNNCHIKCDSLSGPICAIVGRSCLFQVGISMYCSTAPLSKDVKRKLLLFLILQLYKNKIGPSEVNATSRATYIGHLFGIFHLMGMGFGNLSGK